VLAGEKASDFTFKDINPASKTYGQAITLSQAYAEGGVVVNFLASWCGYCWRELPVLQEMADAGQARVLGMAADEYGAPPEILMTLIAQRELTLPILWVTPEEAKELEKRYTYQTLPATYLIRSDGTIARTLLGEVEPERLREEVARVFKSKQKGKPARETPATN
jgi:thiol-disulfide isomerase/thioredoxin